MLANWIAEAQSPLGRLPDAVQPAQWVAQRFLRWWKERVADEFAGAESAVAAVRAELDQLGGWSNPQLGEALHELTHATEALASLRPLLGLEEAETDEPT